MTFRRVLAVLAGLLLTLSWSTAALAHATLRPANAPAGEATSFQLLIPHGCAPGEPPPPPGVEVQDTTLVSMEIPDGMTVVDAQDYESLTVEITDTEVIWSGGTLVHGDPGELTFTAMVDGADGDEIPVNVYQECNEELNYRWTGASDSDTPAPVLLVGSEAPAEEHDHSDPAQHADGMAHDPEVESEPHDHSDPDQHADGMAHDPDVESEPMAMAQADGDAEAEPTDDAAAEPTEEATAEADTDDGAAPEGGPATGQGDDAGGLPAAAALGGLAGVAAVAALTIRRMRG